MTQDQYNQLRRELEALAAWKPACDAAEPALFAEAFELEHPENCHFALVAHASGEYTLVRENAAPGGERVTIYDVDGLLVGVA